MNTVTHSPEIGELAKAVAAAQSVIEPSRKSRDVEVKTRAGDAYGYSYSELDIVWMSCRKALGDNHLAVLQPISSEGARVVVTTIVVHGPSGQWVRSEFEIIAQGGTPQAIGSACTYGRRYALMASLGLVVSGEDDDGQQAEQKPAAQTRSPVPAETPAAALTWDEIKQKLDEAGTTKLVLALQTRYVNPEAGENKDHPLRVHARERWRVLDIQEKAAAKAAPAGGAA